MADIDVSLKTDSVSAGNVSSGDSAQTQRHKLYMASQLKTATDIMKIQEDKIEATMSTNTCAGVLARHMNMKDFAADHEKM